MSVAPWFEEKDIKKKVFHLRMGGMPIPEIAERLELTSDEVVMYYRERVMDSAKVWGGDERQLVINTEMARLDALQQPYWEEAVSGENIKAGEFILKVMAHRAKIGRFDEQSESRDQVANVLIVGGSQQDFMDALQAGRFQHVTGELGDAEGDAR